MSVIHIVLANCFQEIELLSRDLSCFKLLGALKPYVIFMYFILIKKKV